MFSVITNIYNKKTKEPTLMELFTATGKLRKFFLTTRDDIQVLATHVSAWWQELEYHIDVCRVTHGAHIEHLWFSKKKKTFLVFLWL